MEGRGRKRKAEEERACHSETRGIHKIFTLCFFSPHLMPKFSTKMLGIMLVYIYLFYYLLSFVTFISNLGVEQQRITSNYVKSQVTSLKFRTIVPLILYP